MASFQIGKVDFGGCGGDCCRLCVSTSASAGQPMITGGLTSQPIGHY